MASHQGSLSPNRQSGEERKQEKHQPNVETEAPSGEILTHSEKLIQVNQVLDNLECMGLTGESALSGQRVQSTQIYKVERTEICVQECFIRIRLGLAVTRMCGHTRVLPLCLFQSSRVGGQNKNPIRENLRTILPGVMISCVMSGWPCVLRTILPCAMISWATLGWSCVLRTILLGAMISCVNLQVENYFYLV